MKNVQISFDESLLDEIDRFASSTNLSRSAVVREALRHWLKEKEIRKFEEQWIMSIRENPDDSERAEAWINAQTWSDR
ncbi:MAG: ribbon-helix-helix domain-containing protein [Desulfobacterales bacterium]|nr:ribbon-helix-helix domain-containing protein [Desulfobacterales bacterium]